MNCNIFNSRYHNYSVTQEGIVYSKYGENTLTTQVRDGYNEVLFSIGTCENRFTQWVRVDHLVASKYIPNINDYTYLHHKDGNNLNDHKDNLEWKEFCVSVPAKIIKGYQNKYIITSDGRVYNNYTGKQMKSRLICGYKHVGLRYFDGTKSTQKLYKVHRLVAEYFIEKPKDKNIVNHKDGNKLNNNYSNLEWVTSSENNIHAIKNNLRKTNWNKEKGAIVINLIENYKYSSSEIAKLFNVSKGAVLNFYRNSYKNYGLKVNNSFVPKANGKIKKLPLPEYYKEYIDKVING